ncbi:MAG TPA: peptide ABC transporter substrate-binding protein [Candidatus Binatia bacterium]|nr:peptide ABC transporter substrate-binding protein [Candidatus Binatia bacterium]
MTGRTLTLRLRRRVKRSRQQVEGLGFLAGEKIDKHLIHRFSRLLFVRRFISAWLLLFILLSGGIVAQTLALRGYYETPVFLPGGVYTEGVLGDFTNVSPLYATSLVDTSLSRLVFSSLLTYNSSNQLVGDLASNWSVDSTGKIYTVHLKPDLKWQDGQPLTASDVVFTYHAIQDPDAESPLQASWENVTVQAPNPATVVFTLTDPLASFPYSLTNGIIPEHILGNVPMAEMRSSIFNTDDPVGSGPFAWKAINVTGDTPTSREEQITLVPSTNYFGPKPKLDGFIVDAYHDQAPLIQAFKNGYLDALVGLNSVPTGLTSDKNLRTYNLPLTGADMVFYKTSSGVLADQSVRQALNEAVNVNQIIEGLGYPAIPVREPLLDSQLGYNPSYEQTTDEPMSAINLLSQDGWDAGQGGIRYKNSQPLSFNLYAADTGENQYVTQALTSQWRAIGAEVHVYLEDDTDLQDTVAFHTYDALLYGISIGVDPDVFVYWDSSQANPTSSTWLNFSEYKSSAADEALEGGRTVLDPALRAAKYIPFLQAWQSDAPALGLYQPRFLYITREPVNGLTEQAINSAADRFDNVTNWEILTGKADQS